MTQAARDDLAELWAYLATEASEHLATETIQALQQSFARLQELPLSGPARDALAPGLRVAFRGQHAIYYKVEADALVVIRVLHGARDAAALAERGGFK